MKNKKYTIIGLAGLLMIIVLLQICLIPAGPVFAADTFTLTNPLKPEINSVGSLVMSFVKIFSYVVIIFAVLVIIYIGFQYIIASASGDSKKIKELHSWLLRAVVGIAVVIGAQVIVRVVINTMSLAGVNDNVTESAKSALK